MFSSFTKPLTCSYQMTLITSAINVKFKELNRRVTEYMFPIEITLKLHYRLTYYHAEYMFPIEITLKLHYRLTYYHAEYMFPIEITLKLHYRLTYYHAAFNLQIKTNNEFEEKISVDFLQMRIIVLNILFY